MALIKAKKVELTELFYDLVFVYAISQGTALIHHLHQGVVGPSAFIPFILSFVILINTWMVQTVYTNRYGENSIRDILFMFAQMIFLLLASNSITSEWRTTFVPFTLSFGGISFILMAQYFFQWWQADTVEEKQLPEQFMKILAFRGLTLTVAAFLPFEIGSVVSALGILISWWLPSLLVKPMHARPINFPHLVERVSLLVIITFGEMIIGIAPYFTAKTFSAQSVLIFLIVSNLFMFYIVKFDHILDHHRSKESGNALIYFHYLIFFGLSLVTVSLNFVGNPKANSFFAVGCLYAGLVLFIIGVLIHGSYNKKGYEYPRLLRAGIYGCLMVAGCLSFIFADWRLVVIAMTAAATTTIVIMYVRFNLSRMRAEGVIKE